MSKIDISKLDKEQLKTLGKSIDDYEIPQEVYDEAKEEEVDDFINALGYTSEEISDEIDSRMATQGSETYDKLKNAYNSLVDMQKKIDSVRDDASKKFPKELKQLDEMQTKLELDLRTNLLYFKPSTEDEQTFVDMVMLKIVKDANGERDDYGIPKGVFNKDEKAITSITKKAVSEKLDEIFADKEVVKEMREKNIPQEKIDEFRKQLLDTGIGAITKMMLQEIGNKFQSPIRKLSKLFYGAVLRNTKFKKKGSSDETKKFYIKVQKQAQHLQSLDRYKMTHIIKKLANEHSKSEAYIKDIIYKDLSK
tara:strand:- start:309 stop:1232 length:924 start_codon:yes stop_codon:yes gene_type:complete